MGCPTDEHLGLTPTDAPKPPKGYATVGRVCERLLSCSMIPASTQQVLSTPVGQNPGFFLWDGLAVLEVCPLPPAH